MVRWLPLLLMCTYVSAAIKLACIPYPSAEYGDVCVQSSGAQVREVPRYLPKTLEMLLMTGTAISSLDGSSFEDRDLPALRSLHVTEGVLSRVGEDAFCSLPALEVLHLDHNRLEFVDELSFNCSRSLKTVSLVGNPNLRQLPRLVSPSVTHLYLDDCRLASFDVATVEGMPALEVLSLTGNPDLHCPTLISQLQQARPRLRVVCEDSVADLPSSGFPGDEGTATEKSLTEADYSATNTRNNGTDEEKRVTEASPNEPDTTTKKKKDESPEHASSSVWLILGGIAVAILLIFFSFLGYRWIKSHSNSRPVDPDDRSGEPLNRIS